VSVVSLTTEQWTERIRRKLAATVEQIIEVGNDLEAAKSQLGGRWLKVLEGCDMDKRTAQRFMSIASHPVLANTTTWSYLPASYRTLSELARFDEAILERAISNGEVNRETRTRDAEEMYQRYYGTTTTTSNTTTTTHTPPPPIDTTATEQPGHLLDEPPLADENGEPITGSKPREDEGGSDDEGASTDEGAGSPTHDPAPSVSDPDAGYRRRMSAEFSKVRDGLLLLDADRIVEVSDLERLDDVDRMVESLTSWCDAVSTATAAARRPKLGVAR
jgi:hypothetical protein